MKKLEDSDRAMIDSMPMMAWRCRPDGYFEFVNRRCLEYTGLSPGEAIGWQWAAAIHPDDLERLTNRWREFLASGLPGEFEARLRRHDGVFRWFLIRFEPLPDETGKTIRWYGTSTDIEDRKQAEERLLKDERELRRIPDAIAQTIVVQDPNGNPIYANQAVLDYTGLTIEDVLTSDFRARIFHPEDIERLREQRRVALSRGMPFDIEQ